MAHLVETMMSVEKTPWHKLGTILEKPPTAEDAIIASGLNWTVSKQPAKFIAENGEIKDLTGRYAVVRDSDQTCLGDAGATWQPLQNVDAFRFFDPFVLSGEASYETAGSLENGKRIWVLAKINRDPIEVVKGDVVEKFILLTNMHKAGFAVTGGLTPIRVVCNNTLTGALQSGKSRMFNATHSKKMVERLEDIQASIAEADQAFQKAGEAYRLFAKTKVTADTIDKFLAGTFRWSVSEFMMTEREMSFRKKQSEAIMRLFETGRGADIKGVKGTLWGLYNSVTEHITHERGKLAEDRLKSAWFGNGMDINKRAYETALALV